MKALVIEDEVLVAMHIEDELERIGVASIGIAADREEAFQLAQAKPDIAFVDLNLRDGRTGIDIAAHLVNLGIAVFYATANPSDLGEGRQYALDVINKPVTQADLLAAVARVGIKLALRTVLTM